MMAMRWIIKSPTTATTPRRENKVGHMAEPPLGVSITMGSGSAKREARGARQRR